jgi:hypothetical protein
MGKWIALISQEISEKLEKFYPDKWNSMREADRQH